MAGGPEPRRPIAPATAAVASSPSGPASAPEGPAPPAHATVRAKRIDLAEGRGCAVVEDGGVVCWGGRDETAPRRLAGVRDAVDVSQSFEIAVVQADGALLTLPQDAPAGSAMRAITQIGDARAVSQRYVAACALRATGSVVCWPNGFHDERGGERKASPVRGLDDATALSVGAWYGCALKKSGRVACWGLEPGRAQGTQLVPGIADAVEIHVGTGAACARGRSGKVACFSLVPAPGKAVTVGDADTFAISQGGPDDAPLVCLARGDDVRCLRPPAIGSGYAIPALREGPVPGMSGHPVRQLGLLGSAACVLDDAGVVRCFGRNVQGVLGQPDLRNIEKPTRVPGLPKMRALGAGQRFTCGLSVAGEVHCWGQGISLRSADDELPPDPSARVVAGLTDIDRLLVSQDYACALRKAGEATCFFGAPNGGRSYAPVRVPALDGARAAVLPEMGMLGWVAAIGSGGALLVGKTPGFDSLDGLVLAPAGVASVKAVAGAYSMLLVEDETGHVASFHLLSGQISQGPTPVPGLEGALSISGHRLALMPGGEIRSLDYSAAVATVRAQSPLVALLDGPAPCGTTAANELVCLDGDRTRVLMTGVRQVVGKSSEHQCALDGAGAVFCRGANHTGQCGVSVGLFRSDEPVEVALR